MTWPDDAPANKLEEIAEAVRAAYPSEVGLPEGSPLITQWIWGDGNLPDNRGFTRITVWVDNGTEGYLDRAQIREENVTAVRLLRFNFRLWAKDQTSGQLRVHPLYTAIVMGVGETDDERSRISEKWQGFKGKTISGWQVTLSFTKAIYVLESDNYAFQKAEVDPELPARVPIQPVGDLEATLIADGESFGPFVNPEPED